jgi:hypothetical protein
VQHFRGLFVHNYIWKKWVLLPLLVVLFASGTIFSVAAFARSGSPQDERAGVHHVLLISVDGLHAVDLERYISAFPNSALARLAQMGVRYPNASTARPSDSFPGLLSIVTGGSPRSTGVFYDDSYDRTLSPPGSNCKTVGTEVVYDESIDIDSSKLDAGGGIDPATLPLDPAHGCKPVYPHSFLHVNTIFEVVKAAGLRTAWSDKHPAYDLVNGPSGQGVMDLYTPEVASTNGTTAGTEAYDSLKVQAILHEIDGKDHTGQHEVGVPAIFGMNFQAVSVTQKLVGNGYQDALGTPSAGLADALHFVDQSLGKMLDELRARDLLKSTVIVLTAKHGQSPIDPNQRQVISSKAIPALVNSIEGGLLAQATQDDVALLWLNDQSKTAAVVAKLSANAQALGIQQILAGDSLKLLFNDPLHDNRTPDVVVIPRAGVIYTKTTATKIAEHGGFNDEDTNVDLLIANPRFERSIVYTEVQTTQIAPTILRLLGLKPDALQAVRQEQTPLLPGLSF